MKRWQSLTIGITFFLLLLAGGLGVLLYNGDGYSLSERRLLASAPGLSGADILSGRTARQTEANLADHFPARETLRKIKAAFQLDVLRRSENDGVLRVGDALAGLDMKSDPDSWANAASRFREVADIWLNNSDSSPVFAYIPSKTVYLKEQGVPTADTEALLYRLREELNEFSFVDLTEDLEWESFYRTDTHWRQEELDKVIRHLLQELMGDGFLETELLPLSAYTVNEYTPFEGVWLGQSASCTDPDTIRYLTEGPLSDCFAVDLEKQVKIPPYDPEGCDTRDPYTLFAGGNRGAIQLINPSATENRELVIFRDSFAGPLALLLAPYYSRITLIDLRVIHPQILGRFVQPEGKQVLFLFSKALLDNSWGLK